MRTKSILIAFVLGSAAALGGCGPGDGGTEPEIPDQASFCAVSIGDTFPETREVDLGFGPPSSFEPYRDGDEVAVVVGTQGASMITPVVRVAKGAGDGAEPCFRVRVEEVAEGFASEWNIQFREEGGALFSDGALYFITYSTGEVELDLRVEGEGFSGTKRVKVALR
jgi:hypothetical protein